MHPGPAKLSHSAALVLKALSLGYHFGFDILQATGLPSGTIYPALRRLERDGLASSQWEDEKYAAEQQRPSRRYYRITASGKRAAATATERYPLLASLSPMKAGGR